MKANIKKALSLLLALCMVLQYVPATVFATDADHAHDHAEITHSLTVAPETDLPDNDELFAMYAEQQFYGTQWSLFGTAAKERLNAVEQSIYDALKAEIEAVATSGGSTVFTLSGITGLKTEWTNTELGVDSIEDTSAVEAEFTAQFSLDSIVSALLSDCPFDLYWYDKTTTGGVEMGYGIDLGGYNDGTRNIWDKAVVSNLTFTFAVATGYASGENAVTTDVAKISGAKTAAQKVVDDNASKTHYEKLVAYKEYICNQVSYNQSAVDNNAAYGDPWQLIYVFDNDASTNVVCEGYAKAFQYLCDLGGLDCISVTGTMAGGTGAGGHMWNIVTLDDENYLVDVTNSDEGSIGQDGGLFLVGGSYTNGGYSYTIDGQTISYTYDEDMIWSDAELTLAVEDYTIQGTPDIPDSDCAHESFTDGICGVCGTACAHECYDDNGFCSVCDDYMPALGEGTAENPYQISNAGQLYWFAAQVNSGNNAIHAILTKKIVVNEDVLNEDGTLNGTPSRVWTPIGNNSNKYSGTFDGNNKTISGLYFNDSATSCVGLFGYVNGGKIQNVGIVDSYFNGKSSVGAVVGFIINGDVSSCYNTGSVHAIKEIGGIVGLASDYTTLSNCHNTGSVSSSNYRTGGVAGYVTNSSVSNCYYLIGTASAGIGDGSGEATAKSDTEFSSGEVAYLLQGEQEDSVWGQTIGSQGYPVLGGEKVYQIIKCEKTAYSNTNENIGHTGGTATCKDKAVCDLCGASYGEVNPDNHASVDANGKCTCGVELVYKGEIGGTVSYYATLSEVCEAMASATAEDKAVVTLMADVHMDKVYRIRSGVFTIDLNGHSITSSDSNNALEVGGPVDLTIISSAAGGKIEAVLSALVVYEGSVTVKDIKLVSTLDEDIGLTSVATYAHGGATDNKPHLTLVNVVVESTYDGVCSNYGATVKVIGGSISAQEETVSTYQSGILKLYNGVQFPLGISTRSGNYRGTLSDFLGTGMGYWVDDTLITLSDGQDSITGVVTVKCANHIFGEDSVCDGCGAECTHEAYTNGTCDACGYVCSHENFTDGTCSVCGKDCDHEDGTISYESGDYNHVGTYSCCGITFAEDHIFTNGKCDGCGYVCSHETYTNGTCDACGYVCSHETYTDGICDGCGYVCPHDYFWEGKCETCGIEALTINNVFVQPAVSETLTGVCAAEVEEPDEFAAKTTQISEGPQVMIDYNILLGKFEESAIIGVTVTDDNNPDGSGYTGSNIMWVNDAADWYGKAYSLYDTTGGQQISAYYPYSKDGILHYDLAQWNYQPLYGSMAVTGTSVDLTVEQKMAKLAVNIAGLPDGQSVQAVELNGIYLTADFDGATGILTPDGDKGAIGMRKDGKAWTTMLIPMDENEVTIRIQLANGDVYAATFQLAPAAGTAYNLTVSLGHTDIKVTPNDDGETHALTCEACGETFANEKHTGGTATCKSGPICDICGASYGELGDHTTTSEATCMNKAICSVCGEYGEKNPDKHTGNNSVVGKVEPTCGVGGYTGDTVCECGVTIAQGEVDPATGNHNYVTEVEGSRTPATCMAEGSVTMACGCGATEVQTLPIDKNNHTGNTHIEGKVDPTCGADGYTGDTVCECGVTIAQGEVDPATGNHNYVTEVEGTRTPATCMAEGSVTMKCGCGATEVQTLPIDKNNHTGNTHIENKVDPTCGVDGYTGDTVCECGVTIAQGEVDPATGNHNYVTEVEGTRTPATCMAEGSVTMACGCGAEEVQTLAIDKNNHTGNNSVVGKVEPTCGADGYTGDTVCECGVTIAQGEVDPATGNHNYVTEVEGSRTPATCMAEGSVTMKCGCGATEVQTLAIDKNNHTGNTHIENKVEPTCGKDGYTGDTVCECGVTITMGQVDPATGKHSWSDWTVTQNPTTTAEGVKERSCSGCGDVETDNIPKLNEVTMPESNGGDVVVDNETPATGDEVTITVTPDSGMKVDKIVVKDEEGNEIPVKDNGDGTYTYEQPAGNVTIEVTFAKKETTSKPNWMSWLDKFFGWGQKCEHAYTTKVVAPTCDCKGYTVYTCSKCGDSYKDNYTNALGHAWDAGKITKEATCTENGVKTFTCGNCGKTKTETIKATGHNYQDGICNNCGKEEATTPDNPNKPSKPGKPGFGSIWDWISGWWN